GAEQSEGGGADQLERVVADGHQADRVRLGQAHHGAGGHAARPEARVDGAVAQRVGGLVRAQALDRSEVVVGDAHGLQDRVRRDLGAGAGSAHRDALAAQVGEAVDVRVGPRYHVHGVRVGHRDGPEVRELRQVAAGPEVAGALVGGEDRVGERERQVGVAARDERDVVHRGVRGLHRGGVAVDEAVDDLGVAAADRVVHAAGAAGGDREGRLRGRQAEAQRSQDDERPKDGSHAFLLWCLSASEGSTGRPGRAADRLAGMLTGVRVLDLSRVLAGPYCTQLLADLGADVLKVESPGGDDTRAWGPPWLGEESGYFLSVNRGKRSLAVDLKDPRGAEVVRRLAAQADVVVENFKVGDLARYGLDYAAVAQANPRVVYVSITGFGQTGPRAREPGYDAALQALAGVMAMTGEEGRPPVKLPVAYVDVLTGLHAAVAAVAALRRVAVEGRGAHLDVSLFDVALASAVNQAQGVLLTGQAPRRLGSAHPSIVPYQSFEAADGALVLAVGNDAQ